MHDIRFAVLGPLTVERGTESLDTGSPQRQAVLAALLLRQHHTASLAQLIDAVWGSEPPARAAGAIRNHIADLRAVLEPGRPARTPPTMLVSAGDGYALRLPPGAVDVEIAAETVRLATEAEQAGDPVRAHGLLTELRSLWRGEPLSGVPGPYAESQRTRFIERRFAVRRTRIDLELTLGRHAELIGELVALTAEHPLDEWLHAQLMTALSRSGRPSEALDVYTDIRRTLIDELGVEPGPELTALHRHILAGDETAYPPQPAVAPAARQATVPAPRPPAQLPSDIADFTGRTDTVPHLVSQLRARDGRAVTISAISGMGGIGKTTLAVHVAHLVRADFPDGQLYVNLDGMGAHPAAPDVVLGGFLVGLGYAEGDLPTALAERAALFRTAVAGKNVLVVLDNAADAEQVRPLLPGTAGSGVLITSRTTLAGLSGATLAPIDVLAVDEAMQLFTHIVGSERVAAEPEPAQRIVFACKGLPLAVRVAAARLAGRPQWSLGAVADRIARDRSLHEFATGDLAVETIFQLSYQQLDAELARAFRLVAVPEVPDLPITAITWLLQRTHAHAEQLCETLVDLNLLQITASGRYRYHDLLRQFARNQPDAERDTVLARLLDFYLASAKSITAECNRGTRLPEHLSATTSTGELFPDADAARDWPRREHATLAALYAHAAADAGPAITLAADLAWAMSETLFAESEDGLEVSHSLLALLDGAVRTGNTRAEARIRTAMYTHHNLVSGQYGDDTRSSYARAAALAAEADDRRLLATTDLVLGALTMVTDAAAAITLFERAAKLFGDMDDLWGNGWATALAGWANAEACLLDSAEAAADRALRLGGVAGSRFIEAFAMKTHSRVALRRDQPEEAVRLCTTALAYARQTRHRLLQGWVSTRLAEAQIAAGDPHSAAVSAREAVDSISRTGDPVTLASALNAYGQALSALGRDREALDAIRSAHDLAVRLGLTNETELRDRLATLPESLP
ncbi:BTAD domain-containing putative transcriptional regulator [Nocardia sp. NPDC051030]|uniref:AfsR/SARP family transcriptional regulator n=1 Tax=Nocardia sp. NPDC051030 TaxID=3155162 RepID=UPI00342F8123